METQPLDRTQDLSAGETPEDVAILYSWANLQGAKYRDFSANRREYRAQMRHRAAEQLRLMELRAQSEAEAAAADADAEAAAAHAEADAATVKLAASRTMQAAAPADIEEEEEVEYVRKASLQEAASQARRAAAERLEAARRAEAASLANSIARREEREIAEAQASALRQAAQYAESEQRSRQVMAAQPERAVPGRISDPYSPQVLAEGEYFERPGTPVSQLEPNRFRQQRDYIERNTKTELPEFHMPPGDTEHRPRQRGYRPDESSGQHPSTQADGRSDDENGVDHVSRELADFGPRRQAREVFDERHLSIARDAHRLDEAGAQHLRRANPAIAAKAAGPNAGRQARVIIPSIPYKEFRRPTAGAQQPPAEVVSRIPDPPSETQRRSDTEQGNQPEFIPHYASAVEPSSQPRYAADARPPVANTEYSREHGRAVPRPHRTEDYRDSQSAGRLPAEAQMRHQEETEFNYRDRDRDRALTPPPPDAPWSSPQAWQSQPAWPTDPQRGPSQQPLPVQRHAPDISSQPSAARQATPHRSVDHPSGPAWLYPRQEAAPRSDSTAQRNTAQRPPTASRSQPVSQQPVDTDDSLQHSRERVASRWFALKGVFAQAEQERPVERQALRDQGRNTPIVAVFSQAGGVGKTSLVATLGRTLSSLGERVLLTDTTSHGLLPFYFGATQLHSGVVRTFSPPSGSADAPIHMVSYNAPGDLNGDRTNGGDSQAAMIDDLLGNSQRANRVLIDLSADCRWVVGRVAWMKPTILVPLAADMNSVLSIEGVERTFAGMQDAEGKPLQPVYLLNQFDASMPLHLDVREVLRQQLGDRLLPFVIRRSAGVSEALAEGMTIVDYDPDGIVAQDYLGMANWIRAASASAPASVGFGNLRWSER